jgi:hypothetical protein
MSDSIVNEQGLLESIPALKPRQLRRLRREGKIPHLRVGPRIIFYDVSRVLEVLRKMEVTN